MAGVVRGLPFSYLVPPEGRAGGYVSAVHEPSPTDPGYRASSIVPAKPSVRATPAGRSRRPASPPVRLLKPGQKGTKQLLAQYGDRLVCVRYRYDAQRKKRLKTVELLVAECAWQPRRPRLAPDQTVGLRIAFAETAVRDRVKQAGGTWNPDRKVWRPRYDRVLALGLNDRIVDEPASSDGCRTRTDENLRPDAPTTSR